jgi:SAM-dependent methyltransferase
MADQGSEGLLSPFLRRMRIGQARRWLIGRVLDVGSGAGSLAGLVQPENYVGWEIDQTSLSLARRNFPDHVFYPSLEAEIGEFDSVVALAVIEHVDEPLAFLQTLKSFSKASPDSRLIITTPHPHVEMVHHWGSRLGIFSKHADGEHKDLLGHSQLLELGLEAGIQLMHYRRFLCGANQIAVFSRMGSQ